MALCSCFLTLNPCHPCALNLNLVRSRFSDKNSQFQMGCSILSGLYTDTHTHTPTSDLLHSRAKSVFVILTCIMGPYNTKAITHIQILQQWDECFMVGRLMCVCTLSRWYMTPPLLANREANRITSINRCMHSCQQETTYECSFQPLAHFVCVFF